MRTWKALFIVVLLGWTVGCDDSDNSLTGPSSLDVAGFWSGDATLTSASGAGCAGTTLSALTGLTYPFEIELDQNANLLSGTQVSGLPIDNGEGAACVVTGSVSDTGFELSTDSCVVDPIERASCFDGSRRDLVLVSATVNGIVNGDTAIGDSTSTWETTDSDTGVSTGTLTVQAEFELNR